MSDTKIPKESVPDAEPRRFRLSVRAVPDRLDKVLAGLIPEHSRNRLQDWISAGHVLVNSVPGKVKQAVYPGDLIEVWEQVGPETMAFSPEPVDFQVVDQTADWIVVNKPAGLVTHPGAGNWQGTLLNGLLYRFPELKAVARAGIVHRLDKETSGLLVVARHEKAQTYLVRQLQQHTVQREYVALVHGELAAAGTVMRDIGRDPRVPVRMTVDRPIAPKRAVTHYAPRRTGHAGNDAVVTEVVCRLETGRTHQIRVHMASLRHPLVGDSLYGGRSVAGAARQMLHARILSFDDYATHARVAFEIPLADDFLQALKVVSWQA